VTGSNCTASIRKGKENDECSVSQMCGTGLDCLHYSIKVDGEEAPYADICGDSALCNTSPSAMGITLKIRCSAITNMVGMVASIVALYLAM